MDIKLIKAKLKEQKMTYEDLSQKTNLSLSTIKKILSGTAKYPRVDTIETIEKALGITDQVPTSEERELIELVKQFNEEEIKELSSFLDYIISKRK
jgi:transcriptional regulator with XRE-family HTH domain